MDSERVQVFLLWLPTAPEDNFRMAAQNRQGTTVFNKTSFWCIDTDPFTLMNEPMRRIIAELRTIHEEHWGH